jgi:hypothetical protein
MGLQDACHVLAFRRSLFYNFHMVCCMVWCVCAAGRPTVGISLAPSKTPTVKQQQQAAAAHKQQPAGASGLQSQHSIDDALHDLHALHLSPRSEAAAAAAAAASDVSVHGSVTSESQSEASSAAAAATKGKVPWRPLAEYSMAADLAK